MVISPTDAEIPPLLSPLEPVEQTQLTWLLFRSKFPHFWSIPIPIPSLEAAIPFSVNHMQQVAPPHFPMAPATAWMNQRLYEKKIMHTVIIYKRLEDKIKV